MRQVSSFFLLHPVRDEQYAQSVAHTFSTMARGGSEFTIRLQILAVVRYAFPWDEVIYIYIVSKGKVYDVILLLISVKQNILQGFTFDRGKGTSILFTYEQCYGGGSAVHRKKYLLVVKSWSPESY